MTLIAGADEKQASQYWVENHFRLIVWKLGSLERYFPTIFGGKKLTVENTLAQLKYRYEREINQAHRSALKKILEKDEVSTKFLVLCITRIISYGSDETPLTADDATIANNANGAIVEVTDGWYCMNAVLDMHLTKYLIMGRIFPGQKLRIFGAEVTPMGITLLIYV